MTKDDNTKVCVAINAVQNALKAGIPKDHKNAMQGYNFRGIDDIYNVVGPLLPEHGLVILPRMLSRECEVHKNAKGNTMFHVVVKAEYRFKATADGSCEVVEMYGEAMDSSDKATNKAMSAAYKYACIQTFSIPVTGEPDADADSPQVPADTEKPQEDVGRTPRAKSPAPAPKTPPRGVQRQETPPEGAVEWRGWLMEVKMHDSKDNPKYTGKPYILYRVTLSDGKTATTFDEEKFTKAQFIATQDDEVIVKVKPNIRKPGTWEFLDVERVLPDKPESELELAGSEKNEDPF